jgi:hypothetical protein
VTSSSIFLTRFEHTVQNLRDRQEAEIVKLDAAIAALKERASPEALEPLHQLRAEMQAELE